MSSPEQSRAEVRADPVELRSQRAFIDYSLARRALLAEVFAGKVSTTDACDAHPYLLRAAKHHGASTRRACPICRKDTVTEVCYTYGDALKDGSGAARTRAQIASMESLYDEFAVYVVEVCRSCSWNHLVESWLVGTGEPRPVTPRRRG